MKNIATVILVLITLNIFAQNREKAFEINAKLGRGINYGNMFEAPSEAAWGNPWRTKYAGMIGDLGFNHVRIPVRWEPSDRSSATPPYTVSATFLNRIKQVVDSVLNNGMFAIVNMHHHEALYDDPYGQKDRFLAQWKQISEFFKDYPDSLLFELLNEPHGNLTPDIWNDFAVDALAKIREDNPERIVLLGTAQYGGLGGLPYTEIPDDEFIILTVHYYNPFHFTHQGASWVGDVADDWLGTKWNDSEDERKIVQSEFAPLVQFEKDHKIPIHIGEFGAYSKADMVSRVKWTTYIGRYLETLKWSWAYWEFSAGFGIYDPARSRYNQDLVDALLHNEMPEPSKYVGTPIYKSNFSTTTDGWKLYNQGGAVSGLSRADSALHVNIISGGSEVWHVQMNKANIKLVAGRKYRVTFKAKADTARMFSASMGKNSSPWTTYGGGNFLLTDTFAVYSFIFDMQSTDNYSRISFNAGKSMVNFSVKDILVESIVLVPPTGVFTINSYKSEIYPNPATDKLMVNNRDDFTTFSVVNIHGGVLQTHNLTPFLNEFAINELPAGIYFVTLSGGEKRFTTKIIKR